MATAKTKAKAAKPAPKVPKSPPGLTGWPKGTKVTLERLADGGCTGVAVVGDRTEAENGRDFGTLLKKLSAKFA